MHITFWYCLKRISYIAIALEKWLALSSWYCIKLFQIYWLTKDCKCWFFLLVNLELVKNCKGCGIFTGILPGNPSSLESYKLWMNDSTTHTNILHFLSYEKIIKNRLTHLKWYQSYWKKLHTTMEIQENNQIHIHNKSLQTSTIRKRLFIFREREREKKLHRNRSERCTSTFLTKSLFLFFSLFLSLAFFCKANWPED